ncbi:RipA family octameric membrane protein [Streptomyces chartreusis]|uniref:RipA family octameric membrane protein n=1 Tax=Streptomyces chartreusis TaxID=1969 RepID=UPI0036550ACD
MNASSHGPEPESADRELELYKVAVEIADRVSSRRGKANAYFLTVQSAMVTLIGVGGPPDAPAPTWVALALALAGVTLSATWWMQLRSYRDLNRAKFAVINKLEERLPARLFTDEWEALQGDRIRGRRSRYTELGASERVVPVVFAGAHLLPCAGTLST